MAKDVTKQPNYAPLYTSLANSKTQQSNNALYQTIFLLIKQVSQSQGVFVRDIKELNTTISAILNASFMTVNDESHLFFNSRQVLPGTNITFDDSVPHRRTINATGGGLPSGFPTGFSSIDAPQPPHEVYENELYATQINSTFASSGGGGTFDPTKLYWTLLTNGDAIEPELIFASGDVIWLNVP